MFQSICVDILVTQIMIMWEQVDPIRVWYKELYHSNSTGTCIAAKNKTMCPLGKFRQFNQKWLHVSCTIRCQHICLLLSGQPSFNYLVVPGHYRLSTENTTWHWHVDPLQVQSPQGRSGCELPGKKLNTRLERAKQCYRQLRETLSLLQYMIKKASYLTGM